MCCSNNSCPAKHVPPATESKPPHPEWARFLASPLSSLRRVCFLGFTLRFPLDMPCPDEAGTLNRFLKTLDANFGPRGLDLDPFHVFLRAQDGAHAAYRFSLLLNGGDRLGVIYSSQVIVHDAWGLALGEPCPGLVSNGFVRGDGRRHEGGGFLNPDGWLFKEALEDCLAWTTCPRQ